MSRLDSLRILGSGGANRTMEAELKRIIRRAVPGFILDKPERIDTQTLVYPFDPRLARAAVSYLRTPSRVLWDLTETKAARLEPLYDEVRAYVEAERPRWLADGSTISVRVNDATDFPAGALQIRGTIKNAIIDGAKSHGMFVELDAEDADVPIVARPIKGSPGFLIAIDLAGTSMHARGYRLEEGEAPLKETLAAQILMLARWDTRTEVLLDPLAGGGTIPIEAGLMSTASPLWVPPRRPSLDRIPLFRDENVDVSALPDLFADAQPVIMANEIHTPLVDAMKRNIARANVADRVLPLHGDLRDLDPDRLARAAGAAGKGRPSRWPEKVSFERGLIVANPPYGKRLEKGRGREDEVIEVYEGLYDLCNQFPGWRAAFIIANEEFEDVFRETPAMKKPMWNGPIRAWFLLYDL